jgi:peptidoglycan hydrolase-like protein with peptidoglycan-binding domain
MTSAAAGEVSAQEHAARPAAQPSAVQSLQGVSARDMEAMQQALRDSGHYRGPVDGIPGASTAAALEAFKRDRGVTEQGLGNKTRKELGLKPEDPKERARAAQLQSGGADLARLDKDQIRELQRRLQKLGYYNGEVDGTFGETTKQSLSRFYRDQADLAQRGRISPQGASALGLDAAQVQRLSSADDR